MEKQVHIKEKETVYKGFFRVDRYVIEHSLHDGGMSNPIVREVFERGHAAAVLVYDRKKNAVLLIEEFRPGCMASGMEGDACWPLGPIAGMIDEGETPAQAAAREASEEAGVTISLDSLIGPISMLPSPGGCSETLHLFIALADLPDSDEPTGIYGAEGEGENIRPQIMNRFDAMKKVLGNPSPQVGNTVTLLLWLEHLLMNGTIKQ